MSNINTATKNYRRYVMFDEITGEVRNHGIGPIRNIEKLRTLHDGIDVLVLPVNTEMPIGKFSVNVSTRKIIR